MNTFMTRFVLTIGFNFKNKSFDCAKSKYKCWQKTWHNWKEYILKLIIILYRYALYVKILEKIVLKKRLLVIDFRSVIYF